MVRRIAALEAELAKERQIKHDNRVYCPCAREFAAKLKESEARGEEWKKDALLWAEKAGIADAELLAARERENNLAEALDTYAMCQPDCAAKAKGKSWEDCSCGLKNLLEALASRGEKR